MVSGKLVIHREIMRMISEFHEYLLHITSLHTHTHPDSRWINDLKAKCKILSPSENTEEDLNDLRLEEDFQNMTQSVSRKGKDKFYYFKIKSSSLKDITKMVKKTSQTNWKKISATRNF